MLFREKNAWLSVLSSLAIYGFDFWSVATVSNRAATGKMPGLLLQDNLVR
jgi:hypothetical protein